MNPIDSWLTDRSRYNSGVAECMMKRYLQYHAGPYGYGYQLKGTTVPLATGTYVHEAIASVLQGVDQDVAIATAVQRYRQQVAAQGFIQPDADQAYLIEEQCALVEALSWGWILTTLPVIRQEYEVIAVEEEHSFIAPWPNEKQRLVFMARPDFCTRSKATGALSVHDLKTVSVANERWVEQWTDSIQMMGQTLGLEAKLKEPVPQYYVHGLVKGQRKKRDYDKATRKYIGPRVQFTPLIYGWRMPASPPLVEEQWEISHSYVDDDGRERKLGKGWERQPVWPFMPVKDWMQKLHAEGELSKHFILLGPFTRQDYKIKQFLRAMPQEEYRWVQRLWNLYQQESKHGWESVEFQEFLDVEIPRSYNCIQYNSKCPMRGVCFKHPGWRDPVGSGLYVHRRPHHVPEVEQMTGRGIPVPQLLGADDEAEQEEEG